MRAASFKPINALHAFHTLMRPYIPYALRDKIQKSNIPFIMEYSMKKEMKGYLKHSKTITQTMIDQAIKMHGLRSEWAGLYTALNGRPSNDYCGDGFFYGRVFPRLNRADFVNAYRDKNFYDHTQLKNYTIRPLLRKISGRFFDADYTPLNEDSAASILRNHSDELVIKPAIDSGSGQNVWIGPADGAWNHIVAKRHVLDLIVQPRIENNELLKSIYLHSLNTIRLTTLFTGSRYVCLGSVLRVGQKGARVDNQGQEGLAIGIFDDGSLDTFGYDKYFNKLDKHPETGFIFKNQRLPLYPKIRDLCLDWHRFFPQFGLVGWDATLDNREQIKLVEVNLKWVNIGLIQVPHGPIFGAYKDEVKRHYNLPDWE